MSSYNTTNYAGDGSVQTGLYSGVNAGGASSAVSSSGTRLAQSGLTPGASGLLADIAGSVFNINFNGADGTPLRPELDWRVRISMARYTADLFYNNPSNGIMNPLSKTSGVIFPYTPSVSITHNARYGSLPLTHSNYSSYFYEGSEISTITISGEFTVQNVAEGQYLMAVIQFFRTVTKMFFGKDVNAGAPPPMVFLDGYGDAYLPHVPCVVTSFSHTMPADVDYVDIPIGALVQTGFGGTQIAAPNQNYGSPVRLPTSSSVSISLQPVYSRNNISRNFSLDDFSKGRLLRNGFSSTGGFL